TKDNQSIGCAKFVAFCNPVEDNPFMAGAFHGSGEGEAVLSVGVSGPGVVLNALKRYPDADLGEVADVIKKTAFKITRAGELLGRVVAERLDRKSTRLNSSHVSISYAVFCLKKKK